jgi:ribose/xylose/arabinose/galactoside ABC-type transport system permease subunit
MKRVLATLGPFFALAFVLILFAALKPSTFLTGPNLQTMLVQTAVVAAGALGMTLIIVSGGIDLSVGSTIALVTVAIAQILRSSPHLGPAAPFLASAGGLLVAALAGAFIGLLVTGLKLPPFIVTLATWGAYRGLAKALANETMVNPYDTPPDPPNWLLSLLSQLPDGQSWRLVPNGVWLVILLAVATTLLLRYTRFGRHIYAVGSNEQTARLCGVSVNTTKILVYTLGALLAGVAGILQFSYLNVGDPTTAMGMELSIIAAVVIGGASLSGGHGSVLGSLIGAMIMTVVANGCVQLGISNSYQEILTGGIILAAVMVDRLRTRQA